MRRRKPASRNSVNKFPLNSLMKIIFSSLLSLALASCAGYHLGGAKPPSLAGVRTISIPMFVNGTLHPRAEALATSAVADAVVQDGTYRLAETSQADAILEGKLTSIDYSILRSSRLDTRLAEELTNSVSIEWELLDARDPTKILASGVSNGTSSFFLDSNLQTARQNALPDALRRASQGVVAKLATGY